MTNPIVAVRKWYTCPDRQEKFRAVSNICRRVASVYNASSKFLSRCADSAGNSVLISSTLIRRHPKLANILKHSKIFCILEAPSKIYHSIKHTINLIKHWQNKRRRVHNSLKLVRDVSKLTQIAAYFTKGLEYAGKISQKAAAWTTPVLGVSAVLFTARIASTALCIYRTHQTQKKIQHYLKSENFTGALSYVTRLNKFSMKKAFKVGHTEKLRRCIDNVIKSDNKKKIETVARKLKKRITETKISRSLSLIATIVNIVGIVILLFCPINPIGYALLATGGILSVAKFIFDQITLFKFKRSLDW